MPTRTCDDETASGNSFEKPRDLKEFSGIFLRKPISIFDDFEIIIIW